MRLTASVRCVTQDRQLAAYAGFGYEQNCAGIVFGTEQIRISYSKTIIVGYFRPMTKHIFPLRTTLPSLFERSVKPISEIPVFFEHHQIAKTTLNANGEFPIVLPAAVEMRIKKNRICFLPLYEELNGNPDPAKVRLRITAIRVRILPPLNGAR